MCLIGQGLHRTIFSTDRGDSGSAQPSSAELPTQVPRPQAPVGLSEPDAQRTRDVLGIGFGPATERRSTKQLYAAGPILSERVVRAV